MNFRTTKSALLFFCAISFIVSPSIGFTQLNTRTEINIPDIPGYVTLKCDFHMHTVFSDGDVWPTVRIEEAWQQGLDAISITDHIEYLPHKEDLKPNHNRPYEIAKPRADELGIILIKGAEITRSMPPGHFNAIFLQDIDPLDTKEWRDAIKAANDQGAFVFWNHPGWRQPDEIPIWYDEHSELLQQGSFQGIEIVNQDSYYPKAFQWALEKKLVILGNSDVHSPIPNTFDLPNGKQRPITLIFAKQKSESAIKEALLARRTAVYHNDLLMGEAQFLKPIFEQAIRILNPKVSIKGTSRATIQLHNALDLMIELIADKTFDEFSVPETITLYPGKTITFLLKGKETKMSGTKQFALPFIAKNLLIAPDKGLPINLNIAVNFFAE